MALEWYNAYFHTFDMMTELQEYTHIVDQEEADKLSFHEFEQTYYARLQSSGENIAIENVAVEFEKDGPHGIPEFGAIIFVHDIKKPVASAISSYGESKLSQFGIVNLVIVSYVKELRSQDGKALFEKSGPTKVQRANIDPNIKRFWTRFFPIETVQCNPLAHRLQPQHRLITDEAEKERLRVELVKDLKGEERNKTLFDLLPRYVMTKTVSKWYGAYVGDVFEITRIFGGRQRYYRIVVPSELYDKEIKVKAKFKN